MADNAPSCSGSGSAQVAPGECALNEEKTRLAKEIIAVLDESENVWRTVSDKQLILHRLYAEQINVSEKFTQYNLTWRNRDYSVSEDIATFHRFTEIDEQVQHFLHFLEEFEVKTDRSGAIIKGFIRDMKAHIASLKSNLETVISAKCLEDMANLPIPSLEWIQAIPDPEIDILADEWEQLNLEPQITHSLHQLEALVHPNVNNPDDEDLNNFMDHNNPQNL